MCDSCQGCVCLCALWPTPARRLDNAVVEAYAILSPAAPVCMFCITIVSRPPPGGYRPSLVRHRMDGVAGVKIGSVIVAHQPGHNRFQRAYQS